MKKKGFIISCAVLLIVLAAIITAFLSDSEKAPVKETRFMLDTVCSITIYDGGKTAREVLDGAFDLCAEYDRLLSTTISSSDVFRINHSHGRPVDVSEDTAELLSRALKYCSISGGEFDITIYPAKSLWNFSGEKDIIPSSDELKKASELIDYTRLNITGNTVTLPDGMGIDLGAIAKGFIADKIAGYLRKYHVTSAIIDLGGNVYALGCKPDGSDWKVGIRKPFHDTQAYTVNVSDASVVTSGIYQRYFERDGIIYHHILRSSDGMPCDTGLYSVTIISKSSEQCDALSTVCMLLGYEKSLPVLAQYSDVRAVFITSEQEIICA